MRRVGDLARIDDQFCDFRIGGDGGNVENLGDMGDLIRQESLGSLESLGVWIVRFQLLVIVFRGCRVFA